MTSITTAPLGTQHDRTAFDCGAAVLTLADLPNALGRKLPSYPQLPVALLGSLAHADQIAAMAVLVDAKDESAASFYRHFGFLSLQAQPSRLFVPMRLLAQLLA